MSIKISDLSDAEMASLRRYVRGQKKMTSVKTTTHVTTYQTCDHRGSPVKVGPYTIYPGGDRYIKSIVDTAKVDVLVPLTSTFLPIQWGKLITIIPMPLRDYGGVPSNWRDFLEIVIIPLLEQGLKVMPYCVGSHGRTGCFIASLISLLETPEETPDPIAAARKRHCQKAVESSAQARAVFDLRDEEAPNKYKHMTRGTTTYYSGSSGYYQGGQYAGGYTAKHPSGQWSAHQTKAPVQSGTISDQGHNLSPPSAQKRVYDQVEKRWFIEMTCWDYQLGKDVTVRRAEFPITINQMIPTGSSCIDGAGLDEEDDENGVGGSDADIQALTNAFNRGSGHKDSSLFKEAAEVQAALSEVVDVEADQSDEAALVAFDSAISNSASEAEEVPNDFAYEDDDEAGFTEADLAALLGVEMAKRTL